MYFSLPAWRMVQVQSACLMPMYQLSPRCHRVICVPSAHLVIGANVAISLFIVFPLFRSCERVLYQIRLPVSTHKVSGCRRAVVRALLVSFFPLAVPTEPRFPFQHFGVKGDTGVSVVNLLAPEALVARHE
jgi:hypothetical protein